MTIFFRKRVSNTRYLFRILALGSSAEAWDVPTTGHKLPLKSPQTSRHGLVPSKKQVAAPQQRSEIDLEALHFKLAQGHFELIGGSMITGRSRNHFT